MSKGFPLRGLKMARGTGVHPPRLRRAFTLIELLIVVAIIAILAAIALPNFLEAQTRSKVARAQSDLRSLATALEAYRVDQNAYPVVGNPALPTPFDLYIPFARRLKPLTTPVAYISSLPRDPFFSGEEEAGELGFNDPFYCYAPGNLYAGSAPIYSGETFRGGIYSIGSRGPDNVITYCGYCMAHPLAFKNEINIIGLYDPTNGTTSKGDVFRLGAGTLER